tara:strand:- start:509 stop:1114 length:606 start_codon:yes stop_codon:yes gene_type:complete
MTSKKTRKTNITKRDLEQNKKILARLKKKLELRLAERDSMSKRYKLLIAAEESKTKRPIDGEARVRDRYQNLTKRINNIKAEILSLEGGVVTKELLPYIQEGKFGLKKQYTQGEDQHAKVYDYKEGDLYFNDKIGDGELKLIKLMPKGLPEGGKFNLGDDDEGGEMSEGFMDTALKSNFYQQLQIKNNESKLDRTYTNGTF